MDVLHGGSVHLAGEFTVFSGVTRVVQSSYSWVSSIPPRTMVYGSVYGRFISNAPIHGINFHWPNHDPVEHASKSSATMILLGSSRDSWLKNSRPHHRPEYFTRNKVGAEKHCQMALVCLIGLLESRIIIWLVGQGHPSEKI